MRKSFNKLHPVTDLIFISSTVVFCLLCYNPVFVFTGFICAFIFNVYIKGLFVPIKTVLYMFPVLIFTSLLNGVYATYGEKVLLSVFSREIKAEPVLYGAVLGMTVITVVMWFSAMSEILGEEKQLYLFSRHFPTMGLTVMMALRFLSVYRERLKETVSVQNLLYGEENGRLTAKIRRVFESLTVIFTQSVENAIETSDSMRSRGYGEGERTFYHRFRFTVKDTVFCAVTVAADAFIAFSLITGEVYADYSPVFTTNRLSITAVVSYALYALVGLLPIIFDIEEGIRWKLSELKN